MSSDLLFLLYFCEKDYKFFIYNCTQCCRSLITFKATFLMYFWIFYQYLNIIIRHFKNFHSHCRLISNSSHLLSDKIFDNFYFRIILSDKILFMPSQCLLFLSYSHPIRRLRFLFFLHGPLHEDFHLFNCYIIIIVFWLIEQSIILTNPNKIEESPTKSLIDCFHD